MVTLSCDLAIQLLRTIPFTLAPAPLWDGDSTLGAIRITQTPCLGTTCASNVIKEATGKAKHGNGRGLCYLSSAGTFLQDIQILCLIIIPLKS